MSVIVSSFEKQTKRFGGVDLNFVKDLSEFKEIKNNE